MPSHLVRSAFIAMVMAIQPVSACSLFDPCKPSTHRVLKIKPAKHSAKYEARIAELERRLALDEAAIGALQHQLLSRP